MKVCFASYRPFPDGPVLQPLSESDPANIAYALSGDYVSFHSLARLTSSQLAKRLERYDLIIAALGVEAIDLVFRLTEVCKDRVATYSEGHVSDYQRLSPGKQMTFLQVLSAAKINFVYWEKYVPFYRALTLAPVEYLPYPYILDYAQTHRQTISQRPDLIAIPSGMAGYTRNGLASLVVAKKLLEAQSASHLACWLETETFDEDARAIAYLLFADSSGRRSASPFRHWRHLLMATQLDYRPVLQWYRKIRRTADKADLAPHATLGNTTLYRRRSWLTYIKQLAPARLMIDLNNRETVGRNAIDCAALGIACVSTNRSDMQARLFPQTTLEDSWDIDAATKISQRLLGDAVFYQQTTAHAQEAVKSLAPENFRLSFGMVLAKYF